MKKDIIQAQHYLSSNPMQPDKAINILMKYKNIQSPGSWVVPYMIGFAYMQKSELKTASRYLESARKKGGNNLEVFHVLSDCYIKLNEYNKAEPILIKVLNQQEDIAEAWKNLGLVYASREEYEEALRVLGKANNFNPHDLNIATTAGSVYFKCGKLDEAWKAFNAVLSVDNSHIDAHFGKAKVLIETERFDKAIECIKIAKRFNPEHKVAARLQAEILLLKLDLESAKEILEDLLEKDDSDSESRILYARVLAKSNQLQEAEIQYSKALLQGNDPETTIPEYAKVVISNNNYDVATKSKIIRKAAKRHPIKELLTNVPEHNSDKDLPLNIGFISDKFWDNPIGLKFLDFVKLLPKNQFNVFVYSTSRINDSITKDYISHSNQFNFIFKVSPVEIRETMLKHRIDILVDASTEYVPLVNKVIQRKPVPLIIKWAKYSTNPFEFDKIDYLISSGDKEEIFGASNEPPFVLFPKNMESDCASVRALNFSKALNSIWQQLLNKSHRQKRNNTQPDIIIEKATSHEIEQFKKSSEKSLTKEKPTTTIIPDSFWGGYISTQRAEKTVETTRKFFGDEFTPGLLNQIVEETTERLKKSPTDNRAFFVQSRALQAMSPEHSFKNNETEDLDAHLKQKSWWFKRAIYNYWFDKVEWKSQDYGTQVSAIIIANKFKERSIQNLKNLSTQLAGIGEIIFVNNGLEDAEFSHLMPFITTYVKTNGNSGAYLARNMGAIFARGRFLLFVDDDGIPDDDFVKSHLVEHVNREVIVSRGVYYSSNVIDDPIHYNIGTKIKPAYTILEGNAMYKAEAFYKAGGWGDYILFGHGGKDLSYRLLEHYPDKEQQIFVPGSRLHHEYFRGESHKNEKNEKQAVSLKLLEALHPGLTESIESWPTEFSTDISTEIHIDSPALLVLAENKESKFIHLCRNHVYAQSLSDMIEELNQSTNQQHWLLVEQSRWNTGGEGYSIDENKNSSTLFFDSNSKSDIEGILRELLHTEVTAVFFHGLFRAWESYLLNTIGNRKHVGWIIWGGDLYKPIQRNQHRIFPHQKISSIHTVIKGDIELFNTYYGEKPSYSFTYPYPALYGNIPEVPGVSRKKIIVGNSGDSSNNHIEILRQLSHKKDIQNYQLILPVAYNFRPSYKDEIEAIIEELGLTNLVYFHDSFIEPEEYRSLISEVDMLIMAHDRQQAMGNTLMGLYFNKPVFLKQNIVLHGDTIVNPGWKFLEENKLKAFPFEIFNSFETIAEIVESVDYKSTKNKEIIEDQFGLKARTRILEETCTHIHNEIDTNNLAKEAKSNVMTVDF